MANVVQQCFFFFYVSFFKGPATPLLEVLSQRQKKGMVSGEILVNGGPPNESFKRLVGFIPREDIHLAALSVDETLRFAARTRGVRVEELPDGLSKLLVDIVTMDMGLLHAKNTPVGDDNIRGISGGEKRRVRFDGVVVLAKETRGLIFHQHCH